MRCPFPNTRPGDWPAIPVGKLPLLLAHALPRVSQGLCRHIKPGPKLIQVVPENPRTPSALSAPTAQSSNPAVSAQEEPSEALLAGLIRRSCFSTHPEDLWWIYLLQVLPKS